MFSAYTVESQFFEPPRETKIVVVEEIGGQMTVFDLVEGNDF